MKITKEQLKQIIKEELNGVMTESMSLDWEALAARIYNDWKSETAALPTGGGSEDIMTWLGISDPVAGIDPYIATYMDELGIPEDVSTTSPEMSALADKVVYELKHGWEPEEVASNETYMG